MKTSQLNIIKEKFLFLLCWCQKTKTLTQSVSQSLTSSLHHISQAFCWSLSLSLFISVCVYCIIRNCGYVHALANIKIHRALYNNHVKFESERAEQSFCKLSLSISLLNCKLRTSFVTHSDAHSSNYWPCFTLTKCVLFVALGRTVYCVC